MGNILSRKKRVTPVSAIEAKVHNTKKDTEELGKSEDSGSFNQFKIQRHELSQSRNRKQLDCHSEELDSEFSADYGDDDIHAELDRVLAEYEDSTLDSSKTSLKHCSAKSIRSGFHHCGRVHSVHNASDLKSPPQMCNLEYSGKIHTVNVKKEENVFGQHSRSAVYIPEPWAGSIQSKNVNGFQDHSLTKESASCAGSRNTIQNDHLYPGPQNWCALTENQGVPGTCEVSTISAIPVIRYDRSEEELIETIEREFS